MRPAGKSTGAALVKLPPPSGRPAAAPAPRRRRPRRRPPCVLAIFVTLNDLATLLLFFATCIFVSLPLGTSYTYCMYGPTSRSPCSLTSTLLLHIVCDLFSHFTS